MPPSPTGPAPRPGGSSAVGGKPARPKWLLPLLLGIALLIALLLLLSQCGNDDDDAGTPASTGATSAVVTPSTGTPTGSASAGQPAAGATASAGSTDAAEGTVVADGATLLGGADAAPLSSHNNAQAVARAVKVESVPADEGFWVGTGAEDRLWVQLTNTGGESDYRVKQGDSINFTGTVKTAEEGFAARVGVTADEGAARLTEQGHYISVPAADVKLFR